MRWANLGYVEEDAVRSHILQSLISHPDIHDHQADALITLFKLAGATFDAYVDPSVANRCLGLLKDHYGGDLEKQRLVQVRASPTAKGGRRAKGTSGGSRVTGAWLEGPPSTTRVHYQ
jgi:hypothetical protein